MLTTFLLWGNLIAGLITMVVLLLKRRYLAASLLMVLGLVAGELLSFYEFQLLQAPELLMRRYRLILVFHALTTFGLYFYAKTIFRDNSKIYRGPGFWVSVVLALILVTLSVALPLENLIFSPDFAEEQIIYLTKSGFAVYLVLMLYLVFGLVQLERTLAGMHQLQRWRVKAEVFGSGLLLAAFALFFSHSLLYRSLNMNYLGLRSGIVIAGLVFLCYARLSAKEGNRLALSRGIAHRSFVLLIVGGYLIILGLVGEGLRYLNLDNTKPVIFVLLLIGGCGLAVVFLSERLRRKLKVTLHKNFYQSKYDYREQWERFTRQIADKKSLKEIEIAILDLFCDSLACKGAALYLQDGESGNYLFQAAFNFPRDWRPFPLADSLILQLQEKDWILDVAENRAALGESIISSLTDSEAFLVIPLFFDEELVGFVILGEQINTGEELTYEDFDLLRMLARQSVATLQGLRLSDQLSTARELAAIGRLSTFVLHDLKNQASGLSLMLDNARDYIDDPEFQQDMLDTIESTVGNIKGLIARLKNVKEKPELAVSSVDLGQLVHDAVGTAGNDINVSGDTVQIAVDEEEIYKVVLNLLINAKEASQGSSEPVTVEYGSSELRAFVRVSDQGCGMSAEFIRDKLFKPFETTKKYGFGIGLYQCRQIMEAHGGSIDVESREGAGTVFTLELPLADG